MTRFGKIQLAVLLVLFVFGATVAQSQTREDLQKANTLWSGVRVIDSQGWQYKNVTLSWVQGGEALKMRRPDGATRILQPDEIARIFDANGNDITHAIGLARHEEPRLMPAPNLAPDAHRENDDATAGRRGATLNRVRQKRLFSVAVDAGAGYGAPAGAWFEGMEAGMNAQGGMRVMVGGREYLHLAFRHQSLGSQSFANPEEYYQVAEIETTINEFQLMFGRHADRANKPAKASVGFVEIGIAALKHKFSASHGGSPGGFTRFGFASQGGVMLLISESAACDLSASVVWKPGWSGDEGNGFVLGAHAGLTFLF